ncbi:MAG: response regulator transcription factor [Ruminococcus sp.]|nr:response regulator transcription factor [Ruminococcus sp.]
MIKIAIVDDDNILCSELERYILNSCKSLQIKQHIDVYYDGENFCQALENGECYHLLFLDIELAEMNGVGVGNYIRDQLKNNRMQIVFISAKRDYAMELFKIRPMNFLVKPLSADTIHACMQKYLELYPQTDYFRCKIGKIHHNISYDTILYFESDNKIVKIHTVDSVLDYYTKLSDIENVAPSFFLRIHKSYIINPRYILQHSVDSVLMTDHNILAISRQFQKNFREQLMNAHCDGGEELFK